MKQTRNQAQKQAKAHPQRSTQPYIDMYITGAEVCKASKSALAIRDGRERCAIHHHAHAFVRQFEVHPLASIEHDRVAPVVLNMHT